MSSKPTVLFIHGSWHTPKHFERVISHCENAGYTALCPLQPSVGQIPPIGLLEDAQCIRSELSRLIDEDGKEVIVVAHSYGGVVATQALDKNFAIKERQEEGKHGGILNLVYMCAFILPLGLSLEAALGGSLPPFIPEDGLCIMLDPEGRFYQDLPEEEQKKWTSELIKCPAIAQQTPITQTAYLWHPVTYLFCENDQALPYEMQQMMVQNARETGVQFETESCAAGHSPYLSNPEKVIEVIRKISLNGVDIQA
ncbi:alpha/beta-hydrolase [Lophiostoma macrostomum CBS 122681]|uniref:Alpha/beta-hydrolase n=1 Tax=Lophiostoma macrostomum CBS 122681 TaxID=1314788 RepID=A0A6A6SY32_9PLEO|nr:alpha/beta-hydrolase [Lophiostoma macrostomum CBS 122681]